LFTFGSNGNFRTGLNTSTGTTLSPTLANTDTDWTDIGAGNTHGLGVKAGQLWSWGLNSSGRTGQGTSAGSTEVPTQVGSDTNWSTCNAGSAHSMAIKTTGTLWGFGLQGSGRLGNGSTAAANITSPVQSGTDTDWSFVNCNGNSTIASSISFTYAIKTTGSVWAAGINDFGQLGQPLSTTQSGDFLQVGTITNATKVGVGGGFGIVLRQNL
jgi:alpha-tubulin suppressor-like RCC1 family protein